jgi:hypothetical protein
MKLIPYYTLINEMFVINDIARTFGLFIVYMVWLSVNNINLWKILNKINDSLTKNKGDTPGIMLLDYLWKKMFS